MNTHIRRLLVASTVLLSSCAFLRAPAVPDEMVNLPADQTLKGSLAPYFHVGTALSEAQLKDHPRGVLKLVDTHFDSVTAENVMKWEEIQPAEGRYVWQPADRLVRYAEENNLYMVGHVLVWHQQTPTWVFEDEDGEPASRELIIKRMRNHISTYAGRYRGKIAAWDVVNEALDEDGGMRVSPWSQQVGDDFVELAFQMAHEADPSAKLIYNDYNLWKPAKRTGAIALVKRLQARGIRIDGVGMQAHYGLDNPEELRHIEDSIVAFAEAGMEVHITELDLTVLPFPDPENQGADISLNVELQEEFNPFPDGMDGETQAQFEQRYLDLFKIFLKHSENIARVTLWGVEDGQSWRNGWPMPGRTDYPLLLDRQYRLKPVGDRIIEYTKTLDARR